jgi:glutathione S-transferase
LQDFGQARGWLVWQSAPATANYEDLFVAMTLIIGSRHLSSWSLRAWILMRHLELSFDERVIELDLPGSTTNILRYSPNGRLPALKHGELLIWDSLAISEYVCELTGRGLPTDRAARALARSVTAEMHAGFHTLRKTWPMDTRATGLDTPIGPKLATDIARIEQLWAQCRAQFGAKGPWLFGEYSMADAAFAPVVLRFRTYGAKLGQVAQRYQATTLADKHLDEWLRAAAASSA